MSAHRTWIGSMMAWLAIGTVLVLLAMPRQAAAQLDTTLTIGAVRSLLVDTLDKLNQTIETAGAEVKGAGNSLQANAQNVIKDIDDAFGKNVDLTFDRMDETQRAFYRDAQALAQKMKQAASDIVEKTGAEARRTVADADIAAYNTSYSLPCRSQVPRVLYSLPESIRVGRDDSVVLLRGNFLDQGPEPEILANGEKARLLARNAGEIKVELPAKVIEAVTASTPVTISFKPRYKKRSLWLWLYCHESEAQLVAPVSASVNVLPKRQIEVSGWIAGTTKGRETRQQQHEIDFGKPGECDVNMDASRQVCSSDDWKVESAAITWISKNCGSNAGPAQISGDRCVNVPGRIVGCGYDRVLGQKVNCKGHGWLHWKMTVSEYRETKLELPKHEFSVRGEEKESFTFTYPADGKAVSETGLVLTVHTLALDKKAMDDAEWRYQATVVITEGNKRTEYEISSANENDRTVSGRMLDGTLAIQTH